MSYIVRALRPSYQILRKIRVNNSISLRSYVPALHCQLFAIESRLNVAPHDEGSSSIDGQMKKLDDDVRKKNRLQIQDVKRILEDIIRKNSITSSQASMLIRSCGNLLAEEKIHDRIEVLENVWKTIKNLGCDLDISHYNTLLKVYLENEYEFSSDDFLLELKKMGCEPNRITYQRLLERCCKVGDMSGSTRILQYMRDRGLVENISVFNALMLGHCNVNDTESAEGILSMLKEVNVEPTPETYSTLITHYVKLGNFTRVHKLLKEARVSGVRMNFQSYFRIIESYAKYGYEEEIDQILKLFKKSSTYNMDAKNLCLSLIARNKPEAAYRVMKTIQKRNLPDGTILAVGDFFVNQLVKCDIPSDKIVKYCLALMNENLNPSALLVAMESSLRMGKGSTALSLFKAAKRKNIDIRHHYFWPLLVQCGKRNDCQGIFDVLCAMNQEFGLTPNTELVREYVIPVLLRNDYRIEQILFSLKGYGVSVAACVSSVVISLLEQNKLREALEIAANYNSLYSFYIIKNPLTKCLINTKDFDSFAGMLKEVACGYDWFVTKQNLVGDREALDTLPADFREITGRLLEYAIIKLSTADPEANKLIANIFQAMIDYKVGISEESARKVKKTLPKPLPPETVDLLNALTSAEYAKLPPKVKGSRTTLANLDEKTLERLKATMKANHEDITEIQRYLFTQYTRSKNEEKVSQLLKELEGDESNFTVSMYLNLLTMYSELGKLDSAMRVYETVCKKAPQFHFNPVKMLKLAHLLVYNNEANKALEVMKIHFQRSKVWDDVDRPSHERNTLCRRILELLADVGDTESVKKFTDFFLSSGLGDFNNIVLGPSVKVHVVNQNVEAAMETFENCVRKYRLTPYKNELVRLLIEKEDAFHLQRLTDLSTEVHGESNTVHNLLLTFIECGRVKQAEKLLKIPNFVLNKESILNACYRYLQDGSAENIRGLLHLTQNSDFSDRATIYYLLLCVYDRAGDADSALALLTEIQNDNSQPTDEFLITLANLLERNNRPVPFAVPARDETSISTLKRDFGKVKLGSISMKIRSFIHRGKLKEALDLKNSCKPEQLNATDWALLLEACVQGNRYEDSKSIFNEYIQTRGELPLYKVAKFFLGAAMKAGDIAFIEKLSPIISEDEKKRLSFDNHLCRAYINAGRADEFLWKLEQQMKTMTDDKMKAFSNNFPRGGLLSLLLEKPECAARGEKLLITLLEKSKNSVIANTLWIYYMSLKNYDRAERVWTSWLCNSVEPIPFHKLLKDIERNIDVDLGFKLIDCIESGRQILRGTKGVVYGHVVRALVQKNRIEDAIKLLDRANERIGVENVMRSALTSVRLACHAKRIVFPYEASIERNGKLDESVDEHISEGSGL